MPFTITGFDKLQRELKDAERALSDLNGTIAQLKFSPGDPASVDAAIREMERAVDAKVAPHRSNAIIDALATKSKETFRKAIRDKAAAAKS